MDGLSLDGFVAGVCKGNQCEFIAPEFRGGLQQCFGLSPVGLWRIDFVGHLHEFNDVTLLADDKVDFLATTGGLVVINVVKKWCSTSQEFDVHDILKSPAFHIEMMLVIWV